MARARRQIVGEKLANTFSSFMAKTLSSIISDFSDVVIIFPINLKEYRVQYRRSSIYLPFIKIYLISVKAKI